MMGCRLKLFGRGDKTDNLEIILSWCHMMLDG